VIPLASVAEKSSLRSSLPEGPGGPAVCSTGKQSTDRRRSTWTSWGCPFDPMTRRRAIWQFGAKDAHARRADVLTGEQGGRGSLPGYGKAQKPNGVLVIFVFHVLEEVLRVADRVTVLRDGKCVVTGDKTNMDRRRIVNSMIGRDEETNTLGTLSVDRTKKVQEGSNLTRKKRAYNISFDLVQGEIVGFYGLVGAGRTELARILIGARPLRQRGSADQRQERGGPPDL